MAVRKSIVRGFIGALVVAAAILTVGLTASASSAFTIVIRPVFLRLGIDVDVKIGTIHLHGSWSALPESTKPVGNGF